MAIIAGLAINAEMDAFADAAPARTETFDRSGEWRGGARPHPADMSHVAKSYRDFERKRGVKRETIPESWNSWDKGWITSIKNQGNYGTCWAHSTMAAIEAAFKKNGVKDGDAD